MEGGSKVTKEEQDFLKLIRLMLDGSESADGSLKGTDWEEMYRLSRAGKITALILDTVKNQKSADEELIKKWDQDRFQVFVRQRKHFYELTKILNIFNEQHIAYALFKGQILAEAYKGEGKDREARPSYRISSDSDVLVGEDMLMAASEIICSLGYSMVPEKSKEHEKFFKNMDTGHAIELHTCVFEDYDSEPIRVLKGYGIGSLERTVTVRAQGYDFKSLEYTDHLVFQMFHIIKHFVLEGGNIRFFTDVINYCRYFKEYIDMDRFWEIMGCASYEEYAVNFFEICCETFGLERDFLCERRGTATKADAENMMADFIHNGGSARVKKDQHRMMSVMTPYFLEGGQKRKKLNMLRVLFPKASAMANGYKYVVKYPFLLPIAWIERLFKNLVMKGRKKGDCSAGEELKWAQKRIDLVKSVGL